MKKKYSILIVYLLAGWAFIFATGCQDELTAYSNDLKQAALRNKSIAFDIDGNLYHTVKIGSQVWMVENLRVTHYRNGEAIPNIEDHTQWPRLTSGAFCNYNNDPGNVPTYGRLYNWYAVDDPRKLAPKGWHIPSDAEWTILAVYLGGKADAGGKLKEAATSHWLEPNTGATNETGFTAVPNGYRGIFSGFTNLGETAEMWTSTADDEDWVWARVIYFNSAELHVLEAGRAAGFSVRCIKD
jgi:uncharacterized protein (TIGR02145 family)